MVKIFAARVRSEGKITIPKEIRTLLKIQPGEIVQLTIKRPEWWELLDWTEMGERTFNMLPEEIQNKIKAMQISEEKPT